MWAHVCLKAGRKMKPGAGNAGSGGSELHSLSPCEAVGPMGGITSASMPMLVVEK